MCVCTCKETYSYVFMYRNTCNARESKEDCMEAEKSKMIMETWLLTPNKSICVHVYEFRLWHPEVVNMRKLPEIFSVHARPSYLIFEKVHVKHFCYGYFMNFLWQFCSSLRLFASPKSSKSSSVSPYKWVRQDLEKRTPEVENIRKSLVFRLDDVTRGNK